MPLNWSDTLRESEARATKAALRAMRRESELRRALERVGSPLNPVASNGAGRLGTAKLECDTVDIDEGVLK